MNAPWITRNLSWGRLWIIVVAAGILWAGVSALVPEPYFRIVTSILGAVSNALAFVIRSDKYIRDRNELPPAGGGM